MELIGAAIIVAIVFYLRPKSSYRSSGDIVTQLTFGSRMRLLSAALRFLPHLK